LKALSILGGVFAILVILAGVGWGILWLMAKSMGMP
jgi:hypothetical protein